MKHLFLINPMAGKKGSTQSLVRHIERDFTDLGLDFEIRLTEDAGDAEMFTREAVALGEPLRIYACGGDGTLNEVVNGAAGHDHVAVTNIPKGTGNDFIKMFGPDYRHGFCDLSALSSGPQTSFDLIDCNGRLGIDIVCAGIDARVGNSVDRYKSIPLVRGSGAYVLGLIENVLFKGVSRHAKVDMGEMHLDEEITILCVCNGRYYGGGFMPMRDAMPDDGILNMLVVPKVSRTTLARVVGDYAKGDYAKHPDLIYDYHGTTMSMSSPEEMVVAVDGELMHGTQFTIGLSQHKVNFFYPDYLDYHLPNDTSK